MFILLYYFLYDDLLNDINELHQVYLLQPAKGTLRMLEKLSRRIRDSSGGR